MNEDELSEIIKSTWFVIDKYIESYWTEKDIDLIEFSDNFDFYDFDNNKLLAMKEFPTHYYTILRKI